MSGWWGLLRSSWSMWRLPRPTPRRPCQPAHRRRRTSTANRAAHALVNPRAIVAFSARRRRAAAPAVRLSPPPVHRLLDCRLGDDGRVDVHGEQRVRAAHRSAWMAYGISQFLGVISALLFVVSADAYRTAAAHPARVRPGARAGPAVVRAGAVGAAADAGLRAGPPADCRGPGGGRARVTSCWCGRSDARRRRDRRVALARSQRLDRDRGAVAGAPKGRPRHSSSLVLYLIRAAACS